MPALESYSPHQGRSKAPGSLGTSSPSSPHAKHGKTQGSPTDADSAEEVDPERTGVAFGTGIGGVWTLLDAWDTLREKYPAASSP